jgi:hypothetical protein
MIYDQILSFIPQQFKESENFNKILKIIASECDDLVGVFNQIKTAFYLESAIGVQLDIIGQIVQEERNGLNDQDYREAIKFKIFLNTSKGKVEEIIFILKTITDATKIIYSDHPPAGYTIYSDGSTIQGNLNDFIDNLSAAGVSVVVEMGLGEPPLVFPNAEPVYNNLIDENSNNIVTESGLQIVVNINNVTGSDLLNLYNGDGFGVVATNNLTDENLNNIVTENGDQIVVVDLNSESDDKGGYLPITF